jgi:hypothetical protein
MFLHSFYSQRRSTHALWQRGGNASNNSTVLTLLGRKCELLTTFSDDKMFVFVIEDLKDRGIDIKNCFYYPNRNIPLSSEFPSIPFHTQFIKLSLSTQLSYSAETQAAAPSFTPTKIYLT